MCTASRYCFMLVPSVVAGSPPALHHGHERGPRQSTTRHKEFSCCYPNSRPVSAGLGSEKVRGAAWGAGGAGEDVAGVGIAGYLFRGEVLTGGGDVEGGEVVAAERHRGGLVDGEADDRV